MKPPVQLLQKLVLFILLSGLVAFTGCETTGGNLARDIPAPSMTAGVRAGDTVLVSLQSIPQSQTLELAVDDQGFISLPYIGNVKASGLTESQLAGNIADTYKERKIYRSVDVSVSVSERYVYVGGEVGKPGRIVWTSDLTLLKAVQSAGGFGLYSQKSGVILSRDGDSYIVNARQAQNTPSQDPRLYPGDSITILRSNL